MFKLNRDVLYLIFKKLQNDKKTLFSCLTVNKTWCEIIIPILWRDPWKCLEGKESLVLLKVIISHLSDESRDNLKGQGVDFLINPYQRPLFDYISFCRHLNLNNLNEMFNVIEHLDAFSIIKKEIFNLFVNENTRLSHLYIPHQFDYQMHLIPGVKHCFSELEFLSCNTTSINDNALIGLTEICKSIKELELIIEEDKNNYGIIKLYLNKKVVFVLH